jgi:hypothetical protein
MGTEKELTLFPRQRTAANDGMIVFTQGSLRQDGGQQDNH